MAVLAASVDARVYLAALTFTVVSGLLLWDDSGAAGVAAQSVARDEERTGGCSPPAPFCPARPAAGRTNRHLHAASHGLPGRGARHGAHAARSAGLPATGRDAGRDGPEPGGTGRRRAAREKESDDRGGAQHPRCGGSGHREPSALYRRSAWRSGFPARDDRVHTEQFRAGALRIHDVAGIPGGCRHSASGRTGFLLARHHRDALCGDRKPNLCAEDVGRHAGDRATLHFTEPLDRSGRRGGGRQVPQHARVATAGGVSVVVAKRAELP